MFTVRKEKRINFIDRTETHSKGVPGVGNYKLAEAAFPKLSKSLLI